MKLHLPSGLRKALLACIAALAAHSVPFTVATGSALVSSGALVSFALSSYALAAWQDPTGDEWSDTELWFSGLTKEDSVGVIEEDRNYWLKRSNGGDAFVKGGAGSVLKYERTDSGSALTLSKTGTTLSVNKLWLTSSVTSGSNNRFLINQANYLTSATQEIYLNKAGLQITAAQSDLSADFIIGDVSGTGLVSNSATGGIDNIALWIGANVNTSGDLYLTGNSVRLGMTGDFSVNSMQADADVSIVMGTSGSLVLAEGGSVTGTLHLYSGGSNSRNLIRLGNDSEFSVAGLTKEKASADSVSNTIEAVEGSATFIITGANDTAADNITIASSVLLKLADSAKQSFSNSTIGGGIVLGDGSALGFSGNSSLGGEISGVNGMISLMDGTLSFASGTSLASDINLTIAVATEGKIDLTNLNFDSHQIVLYFSQINLTVGDSYSIYDGEWNDEWDAKIQLGKERVGRTQISYEHGVVSITGGEAGNVVWTGGDFVWTDEVGLADGVAGVGWKTNDDSQGADYFYTNDNVTFSGSGNVSLGEDIFVGDMTVNGTYSFTMRGHALNVAGQINVNGSLTLSDAVTINGSLVLQEGTLSLSRDTDVTLGENASISASRGSSLSILATRHNSVVGEIANEKLQALIDAITVVGDGNDFVTLELRRNADNGAATLNQARFNLANKGVRVLFYSNGDWAEYANISVLTEVGLKRNTTNLNGENNVIGRITVKDGENGNLALEAGAHLLLGGDDWEASTIGGGLNLNDNTLLTLGSDLTVNGALDGGGLGITASSNKNINLTLNGNGTFNSSINLNSGNLTKGGNNTQALLGGITANNVTISAGSLTLSGTLNIAGTLNASSGTGLVLRNESVALYQGDTNSAPSELNSVKVSMADAWLSVVNGTVLTLGSDLDVSGVSCYGYESNNTLGTIQAAEGQQVRLTLHGGSGNGNGMHSNTLTLDKSVTLVMEEKAGTDNLQKIQGATIGGNVEVNSGTLNFTWTDSSIGGELSGSGGTLKVDSGANLTLTGGGTYRGTLYINGVADNNNHTGKSSLLLGADLEVSNLTAGTETRNAVGVTNGVDVAGGSTVDLTVNMSSNQNFGANKLTLNEGVILVKKGAGTWTVTDGLTITSGLRVEEGTYALDALTLSASYGVTLDGGTLSFSKEQTSTQLASEYTFGTLTIGAGNGTLNLGTQTDNTHREVEFAKLTGSGNLNVGTLSGSSDEHYQQLTFSEVKDFHGTVSGSYSGNENDISRVVINHVNQATGKHAQFRLGVYSSNFRFEGVGSLTLTSLTVDGGDSGKLYMNYDGTFSCDNIILGEDISLVYTYAGESSQSKVISLALADVLDKSLKLDITGVDEEYRTDGINLGIALGESDLTMDVLKSKFTLSGLTGEWHLEDKDGVLYLFAGELDKVKSAWDEQWEDVGGLTGAPEAMVAQSKEFGSTTTGNAHIWVLSTDGNQRGEVYLNGGGCDNGSAIVLGGALYDTAAASLRNKVSWIRMDEGNYHILVGGSSCLVYTADTEATTAAGGFFANAHIQVEGGTVDYIVGGNHVNNSSFTFRGNSYISVMDGATVKGGIVGGSTLTKGSNNEHVYAFEGNTNIFIYTALGNPGDSYTFKGMWDGTESAGTGDNGKNDDGTQSMYGAAFTAIVGGNAWIDRADSGEGVGMNPTFHGNSNITIDLTALASGTFAKDIVGGNYTATLLSSDTEDEDNMHNTTFEGSSYITIIASEDDRNTVTFAGAINGASRRASAGTGTTYFTGDTNINITGGKYIAPIAGGFFFESTANGDHGAYLDGNTTVSLHSGAFWRVVGGSYSLAGASGTSEILDGDSRVVIDGMVYFDSFDYAGENKGSGQKEIPFIAGGSFFRSNAGSNVHKGNASVSIGGGQLGLFDSVHIVGGDYANFNGSQSASSSVTGNTGVTISGVNTTIQGIVVGGSYLTDEGAGGTVSIGTFNDDGTATGTSSVTISGGNISSATAEGEYMVQGHDHNGIAVVGGSMLVDLETTAGSHTLKTANTAVSVSSGTITGHIVGGHYATNSDGTNTLTITGTTTINLTGGTIGSETKRNNIIGGHFSANTTSPDELNLGDVTITVGGSSINGDIIGGSWREATVALESTAGDKQNKGTVTITLTSGTLDGDVWAAGYHKNNAKFTAHTASTEVKIGSGFTFSGTHTVSGSYYKGTSDLSTVGSAKLTFGDAVTYDNISNVTFKDFSEIAVTNANANVTLANDFSTEFDTLTKSGSGTLTVKDLSRSGSTDKLGLTVSQGKVVLSQGVTLGAVSVAGELELGTNTLIASSLSGTGKISLSNGGHISGLTSLSSTGKLSISISDLTKAGLLAAEYDLFQGNDFDSSWWNLINLDIDGLSGWTNVGLILNDNGSIRLAEYTDEIVWNGGSAEWAAGDTDIEWTNSGVDVSFANPHLTGNKVNVRFNDAASATTITLSGAITVDNISIGSNNTINAVNGSSLTINGSLTMASGSTLQMSAANAALTLTNGGVISKLYTYNGGTLTTGDDVTINAWEMGSSMAVTFNKLANVDSVDISIGTLSKNVSGPRTITFAAGVNAIFTEAYALSNAKGNGKATFNGNATFRKTAEFKHATIIEGAATFDNTMTVSGGSSLTLNGSSNFGGDVKVSGDSVSDTSMLDIAQKVTITPLLTVQGGEVIFRQGGEIAHLKLNGWSSGDTYNGGTITLGADLVVIDVEQAGSSSGWNMSKHHFNHVNGADAASMVYVVTGKVDTLNTLTGADIGANVGLATNAAMELADGFAFSGTLKTGANLTLAGGATVGTLQLNNTLTMDKGTTGSHKLTLTTLELGSSATLNVGANGLSKSGALISAANLSGRLELRLTKDWNLAGALENEEDEYVTYNLFDGNADWAELTLAGLDGWNIESKFDRWDVEYEGGNLVFHHTKYSTPNIIYWATDADGIWKASNDDTNDWAENAGQAGEYQYEADRSVIFAASAQKAVKVYGDVQAHNMTVQEAGYSYTAAEAGGSLTISGNLEVGAATEFAVGTTVVGTLSGAGQLTVSGSAAERLTAQGGVEYSGEIIVNGVFDVGVTVSSSGEVAANATAIKSSLGEVTLNSGATLNMGLGAMGNVSLSSATLSIYDEASTESITASAGEIQLNGNKTLSVTDDVKQTAASGALAVSGTGALAVSGVMELGGELAVSGAAISVQGDFSAAKATLNSGSQLSVSSGTISTLSGNGGSLVVGKAMEITHATGTLTSLTVNGKLMMGSNNGANQLTLKGLTLGADAALLIDGTGLSAEKALFNLGSGFILSGEGVLALDLTAWHSLNGSLTDRKSGHSFALFGGDGLSGLELEADIMWDKVVDDGGEWEVALEGGNLVFSYKAEELKDGDHLYWSDDSGGTWSEGTQWGSSDNGDALYDYDEDKTIIFGDSPDRKDVVLDGHIEVGNVRVEGDYNFVTDEEKGSLTVQEDFYIAYTKSATFIGNGTVKISSVKGEGTLVVDVVEGDGVTLTLGKKAKDSFNGNVTLNQGKLTLVEGLVLEGSDDAVKTDTGILNLVTGELNVQSGDVKAKQIIVGSAAAKVYRAIAVDANAAGEEVLISGADSTLSAESIVGMGTLKNAAGLSNTLAGDASGFVGTIAAGKGSTWTLEGSLSEKALGMNLAGEGDIVIEYSGSAVLELAGEISESVSVKNAMGAGKTLTLTHAANSSTGSLILDGNTIQLGTADKAGSWAGRTVEGAGELVLMNGALKAAVVPAEGVSIIVDARGEVNAGGTAGSDISRIVVHGDAGALLTNVAGGIEAGGKSGMSVALVLGKQHVANTKEAGTYLITESGDLTVNEIGKNGLTLDFSTGAFVETLKAHRTEYKTRVHILSGGKLTNKGGELNDLLSGAYGTLLEDIGFNFVGTEGGDLVLSGTSKDVYLALNEWSEDGVTDEPDAKSRSHSVKGNDVLSKYKATVVDADVTLDVEAEGGKLQVNNLVGLEGASFHAHAAEGAGEVSIVLNNAAVSDYDENGMDHVDEAVEVKGQDTSFAGSIEGERGVHFVKSGAGTLTVGSEQGSGGLKLAGNLTLRNGGITLQGDDDSTVNDLIFAYEDGAEVGGLCVTNDATLTVKGSMSESDGRGGQVSLEKQGALVLNGKSELSHTSISGDGTGSLTIGKKGSLTLPADGALSNVSATVDGVLDLGVGKGNSLSGLSGSGTLAGATGCELTLTGASSFSGTLTGSAAGSASGSMSGGGTLTVAEGASLSLINAKSTDYVWNVNVQGGGSLTVDVQKVPTELGNITLNEGSAFTYVLTTDNDKRLKANLDVLGNSDFTITIEGEAELKGNIDLGMMLTQGELSLLNVSFAGEVGMYLEAGLMKDENGYLSVGTALTKEVKWTTGGAKNAQAGASMFWNAGMPGSEGRKHMDENPLGDLSIFWHGLYTAQGNGENTDRAFAAGAGASVSVLGSAVTQDMERQLNTIRNRTSMLCDSQSSAAYHAWLSAESSYHKLDADGLAPGFTLNGWGGTVGMDTQVQNGVSLGLSITAMYNDLKTESADNGSGDLDTTYLSAFARVAKGAWSHTIVLSAGMVDTSLNRTVSSPLGYTYRTHGETDGYALGAMYEVGYTRIMNESGTLAVQPIANVKVKYANLKGYSESGSDAGLRVDDISHSVVTLGTGVRLQMVIGDRAFNRDSVLEARALLKVDLGDLEGSAATSLRYGSGRAGVESAGVGRAGIELGAGLSIPINSQSGSVFVDGSLELRAGYTSMNAGAGYRVSF